MDGLVCCGLVICIFTLVYNNVCMYIYMFTIIWTITIYNDIYIYMYMYMYMIYSQGLSIIYSIHMVILQILRPWESRSPNRLLCSVTPRTSSSLFWPAFAVRRGGKRCEFFRSESAPRSSQVNIGVFKQLQKWLKTYGDGSWHPGTPVVHIKIAGKSMDVNNPLKMVLIGIDP